MAEKVTQIEALPYTDVYNQNVEYGQVNWISKCMCYRFWLIPRE